MFSTLFVDTSHSSSPVPFSFCLSIYRLLSLYQSFLRNYLILSLAYSFFISLSQSISSLLFLYLTFSFFLSVNFLSLTYKFSFSVFLFRTNFFFLCLFLSLSLSLTLSFYLIQSLSLSQCLSLVLNVLSPAWASMLPTAFSISSIFCSTQCFCWSLSSSFHDNANSDEHKKLQIRDQIEFGFERQRPRLRQPHIKVVPLSCQLTSKFCATFCVIKSVGST